MSKAWPKVPIRDAYRGLFDGPHATPKPCDEGAVFLGIGNITEDGHLDLAQTKRISEDDFPRWTKRVLPQSGDIVFTYEATLNRYAIVPNGFRGCLGRRLALIRPNPEVVNTRWLHYYFFSPEWRAVVAANTLSGATVDRIPLSSFPDFPIRLPDLQTQHSIASILSAYDDLIENNTRRIAILEEMARRIYEEWFVRFRFPGHEQVKMVESELGLIPEGWKIRRLGDVVELAYGKALKAEERKPGPYPVYGSSGVVGFHEASLTNGPGIIVGRKGNVGSVHWCDLSFYPIDTVYFVRTELPLHYVFFNLKRQNFINNDAAVPGLNRNQAYSLHFLVPSEGVLGRFVELCVPLFKQVRLLAAKNANLRTTRDLLLPKLISGELDVSTLPEPEEAIAA